MASNSEYAPTRRLHIVGKPDDGQKNLHYAKSTVERTDHSGYSDYMDSISRYELDARLEAMEAKMDQRVERIVSKLEAHLAVTEGKEARIELLVESAADAAKAAASVKTHMWLSAGSVMLTVIAVVVSAYFANQSSNIAIVQAVSAMYQQGQDASKPNASTKK